MPINTADISFNDQGTPVSSAFDDVYFSNDNGLAETRYVFIDNNHLTERWQNWQQATFTIAETGFGTGLNFLVAFTLFKEFKQNNPAHPLRQLHFVTFEKFPLLKQDLHKALQSWPELNAEAQTLINHYPLPIQGCHRLLFNQNQIVLDLWLGDVNDLLTQLPDSLHNSIDAWFLDGFAPSKNPDMWQASLFQHIALLTAPEGTFATFTAAGMVKRGLKEVGFEIEKCKGFGKKRDMLRGKLIAPRNLDDAFISRSSGHHFWHRTAHKCDIHQPEIAIIGGGLAGVSSALSLVEQGYQVRIYHADSHLASGASGNRQGGFYPLLNVDFSRASQFYAQSFLFAKQRYQTLLANGFLFEHDFCGVLLLAFNQKQRLRQQTLVDKNAWPKSLIQQIDTAQAEQIAGIPLDCGGLFIPEGGWINPAQLVQATAKAAESTGRCQIFPNHKLQSLSKQDLKWQLMWEDGTEHQADIVVVATGHQSMEIDALDGIPMQPVRGQVESVPAQGELASLTTVLCHKGYLTPQSQGQHALGATFIKDDTNTEYRAVEERKNLESLAQSLPECSWAQRINTNQTGRASVRCATPDRLPIMGNVPDLAQQKIQFQDLYKSLSYSQYPYPHQQENLFVLTGLGSRGICTAPLLAEALACQISGKPLPLSRDQLNALNPNRFLFKPLVRREIKNQESAHSRGRRHSRQNEE